MQKLLSLAGGLAAILGVLLCLVAGGVRVTGLYMVGGYALSTLFLVGTGLMVMGCLAKLYEIAGAVSRR